MLTDRYGDVSPLRVFAFIGVLAAIVIIGITAVFAPRSMWTSGGYSSVHYSYSTGSGIGYSTSCRCYSSSSTMTRRTSVTVRPATRPATRTITRSRSVTRTSRSSGHR